MQTDKNYPSSLPFTIGWITMRNKNYEVIDKKLFLENLI